MWGSRSSDDYVYIILSKLNFYFNLMQSDVMEMGTVGNCAVWGKESSFSQIISN